MSKDTITYLSSEWFEEANKALKNLSTSLTEFFVGIKITDKKYPDIEYTIVFRNGSALFTQEETKPTVTITMDWGIASEIAQGRANSQQAFLENRLTIDGDIPALSEHAKALASIEDHLVDLRSRTNFSR